MMDRIQLFLNTNEVQASYKKEMVEGQDYSTEAEK